MITCNNFIFYCTYVQQAINDAWNCSMTMAQDHDDADDEDHDKNQPNCF